MSKPRFTDRNLYDADGMPDRDDIRQDALGDCYFVATLGTVAGQQPDRIRNAIVYNSERQTFSVTLYEKEKDKDGKETIVPKTIEVTQAEIADNIDKRKGGSTADNTGRDENIWPAVMETAYAKSKDADPAKKGLDEGYTNITNRNGEPGGLANDAMLAITGVAGSEKNIVSLQSVEEKQSDGTTKKVMSSVDLVSEIGRTYIDVAKNDTTGKALDEAIKGTAFDKNKVATGSAYEVGLEYLYADIEKALREGRPVTLNTREEPKATKEERKAGGADAPEDGLIDRHSYMVERIYKDDAGRIQVQLRNPHAHNNEGPNGHRSESATITIPLDNLVRSDSVKLVYGPKPEERPGVAPPAPAQQTAPAEQGGSRPTEGLDGLIAARRDDAAFQQALRQFAATPEGQAFRNEGQQAYAQAAREPASLQPAESAPGIETREAPARRM
ncbi:MAG: hypothetical protein KA144_03480 [Xanthomonadaceae bacterium]|nr:hypothetical protein [Xanthomonadaceae bacterium]